MPISPFSQIRSHISVLFLDIYCAYLQICVYYDLSENQMKYSDGSREYINVEFSKNNTLLVK